MALSIALITLLLLGTFTVQLVHSSIEARVESGQEESLILEKFRLLLGIGSLHKWKSAIGHESPALAPVPAAIEAPPPSPTPIPIHPLRRRLPRLSVIVTRCGSRKPRRVLVAVLVLVSAALAMFVGLLTVLVWRHYRRKKNCVSVTTVSVKDL